MYQIIYPRGLGMDYYGLLAQADLQSCDPQDSACVSNNVAKQAAVEQVWTDVYQKLPGGAPDNTVLQFAPQTQGQVNEFYSGSDPFNSGNVVDTRGIMTLNNAPPPPPVVHAAAPVPPVVAPVVTTPGASAPPGKVVVNSSGVPAGGTVGGTTAPLVPDTTGFSFDSIPWWAWAGGAAAAFFAFGRGR